MAVRIRLARMGRKKKPFYRVVVANSEAPRDGRYIENVGTYDTNVDPAAINLDAEKALKWLKEGAKPTETVRVILKKAGILETFQKEAKKAS